MDLSLLKSTKKCDLSNIPYTLYVTNFCLKISKNTQTKLNLLNFCLILPTVRPVAVCLSLEILAFAVYGRKTVQNWHYLLGFIKHINDSMWDDENSVTNLIHQVPPPNERYYFHIITHASGSLFSHSHPTFHNLFSHFTTYFHILHPIFTSVKIRCEIFL